jgi:hypothetical protein
MASDYGLNFGFRVSDESVRLSNGRLKTPASGATLLQGTLVEQDAATGYLKVAAAAAPLRPGTCGLLVQEEAWDRSIYESDQIDSFELNKTKKNRLSVITTGAGTKVWFKNTAAQTRADGRVIDAVTMFVATNVAVGRGFQWNGTAYADAATPATAGSIGEVVEYDAAKGLVVVVLNK